MIYKEVFGTNVLKFTEVLSTNLVANSMLKLEQLEAGSIILAEFQTAGKGMDQNSWESESRKNILMSAVYNSDFLSPEKQFYLNKIASLAVSDTLFEIFPKKNIKIKWPNDIYIGDEKIAGILINNTIKGDYLEYSVLGIGLNVNQMNFVSDAPNPTSIAIINEAEVNREKLFVRLCDQLNFRCRQLRRMDLESIDKDYMSRLYRFKKYAKFIINENVMQARITGLDPYGKLMLQEKDGNEYCCDLKEVSFVI